MKTRTSWTFTPDEFAWIWAETGSDEYPYPISIIETGGTAEEYHRRRAEISARHPHYSDPDLTGPLRVLAHPELRIAGVAKSCVSPNRSRTLAAAIGDLGVVLYQAPGPTPEFGGNLKLTVTRRTGLGDGVAATLPRANPGMAGRLRAFTPAVRGEQAVATWGRDRHGRQTDDLRIHALLRASRRAEGNLGIERFLHSERPHPPTFLYWIDIADNHPAAGRYLITVDSQETSVVPVDSRAIAKSLRHHIRTADPE